MKGEDDSAVLGALADPVLEQADRALTSMQEGVWDWDLITNDCYLSDRWWTNLGYKPQELANSLDFVFSLIHPDDHALIQAINEQAKAIDAPPYEVEFRLRAHDGSYRWTLARGHVQRDATGRALRIVGVNTDTTEERRMRAALERKKEFNDKLIAASVDGIFAFDKLCRLTAYNPAMEQMWGYTRAHVLGHEAFELFPFLRQSHEDCLFYDALAGRSKVSRERPYRHAQSGRTGLYEAQYVPLTEADGKVIGGFVVVRETSAEKERAVQHRLLLEAGSTLVQTIDIPSLLQQIASLAASGLCDWCVVVRGTTSELPSGKQARQSFCAGAHVDEQAAQLLHDWLSEENDLLDFFDGQSLPKIDGQAKIEHIAHIPDALVGLISRDRRMANMFKRLGFGAYVRAPLIVRKAHFGTLTLVNKTREMDDYAVSTAELFAHRAALALDNAKLFAQTQEARQVREQVLATVSRELAHPLASIERACHSARDAHPGQTPGALSARPEPDSETTLLMAGNILRYVERMKKFIGSILDAANLEGGRFAIEPRDVALGPLMDELIETLRPVAEERDIQLLGAWPPSLPEVRGDKERLGQVIANLIDNAIKFSPSGSSIRVSAAPEEGFVALCVADEGAGIAPEQQKQLFERLWQSPGDRHQGSGLGLYIAEGIIRAHGGSIDVHSVREGSSTGTTFVVRIPLVPLRSEA